MGVTLINVTFDCGHTVEVMAGTVLKEDCPACEMGLEEGSTRCEDFPCCGHTDGDGCMPNPRHTSEYWSARFANMTQDEMDYMDQMEAW